MTTGQLPFQVSASSLFPAPLQKVIRPLEPALLRLFLPDILVRSYSAAGPARQSAAQFAESLLQNLDIRYEVQPTGLERIPAAGRVLLVANHPFGLLEGMILLSILEKIRPDYRIVANSLLSSTPALRERLIFVNPFQEDGAPQENGKSLRACMEWLHGDGLLVMFPAGEVAHLNWSERTIADPPWNSAAARLARKTACTTLPVFFKGANSIPFQMLGTLHPRFRTLNLPRELVKKRSQTIDIRVGTPISAAALKAYPDAEAATEYLRARTYLLLNRPANQEPSSPVIHFPFQVQRPKPLAPPVSAQRLVDEVNALGPDRVLLSNDDFSVILASAREIPWILREIGRSRELTYREIGEGTGNSLDLDEFDEYYDHMFLWHARDRRIAGAYRVVATPDVLPSRGIKGLYTNTLFQYEPAFFDQIGPGAELGRSFVSRDYQKHYAPLLLLWKGIAKYVQRRPECAVLFGAVSVSSDYHTLSRTLIVNFLKEHTANNRLSGLVRPRRGFRARPLVPKHIKQLSRLLASVDELSASIQDLECDRKGLPVLIRQYLKIGGQILGFNVDQHFSNALDALILADLRTATPAMLERCMGRTGAAEFHSWHAAHSSQLN